MTGAKRVAIARRYKKQMAKLQRERDRLYAKALKEVGRPDTTNAYDYFYNDQVGFSSFEEDLRGNSRG